MARTIGGACLSCLRSHPLVAIRRPWAPIFLKRDDIGRLEPPEAAVPLGDSEQSALFFGKNQMPVEGFVRFGISAHQSAHQLSPTIYILLRPRKNKNRVSTVCPSRGHDHAPPAAMIMSLRRPCYRSTFTVGDLRNRLSTVTNPRR